MVLKKSFNLILKHKIAPYKKIIKVDSDKSMSIRSFLIGAISQDISIATNVLESEDVISTIKSLKKLGTKIQKKNGDYLIYGKGLGSLRSTNDTRLNFGNSGTLARLLIGILATTPDINVKITGDKSLNKRSMKKLIDLMSKFGAAFLPKGKYNFPLKMISSNMPIGIKYSAGVSAQLKSAVIFAGLNSYGKTEIVENERSRDHTENILKGNNQSIKFLMLKKVIEVFGRHQLKSVKLNIPGDPSSAAFFTALTLLNKSSSIRIKDVGLNKTRTGFYRLLKKRGAKIKFKRLRLIQNELRGDILVKSSSLKAIKAAKNYYTSSTDEYPILFIIAGLTKGVSIFKEKKDLDNKESDRIKEMQKILSQVGIKSVSKNGEVKIFGKGMFDGSKKKIIVPNLGDHRICMSSFILSILTGAKTNIKNFETVFTSSPSFLKIATSLGVKYEIQ